LLRFSASTRVPCHAGRLFIESDGPMLEDDLEALETMFHADGDGLPEAEV
jgi:hypothetical protein